MANTDATLIYHIVFSTKNEVELIRPEIEERVWAYIGEVARKRKMTAIQVGGAEDHIHALVMAPPTLGPLGIAKYLKGDSSKWIQEEFPDLRWVGWEDKFSAFSVCESNVPGVVKYIQDQREQHKTRSFQDELLELLKEHFV